MSQPAEPLFTVPIPAIPSHPGGQIVCTSPSPLLYILTFTSPPDNRLTPPFCAALLAALDILDFRHPPGVVVTTSSITKFYSNGLDLDLALKTPGFTEDSLYPLFRRFLTYPMPTVALVNGHCFAGGLMLAMHHDYRVFSGGKRGYLCINEVEFGAPLLPPMAGIFRIKTRPDIYRSLALEARRFDGASALEAGLLDSTDGMEGLMRMVKERGLMTKAKSGVYGMLKAEMYKEQVRLLDARGEDVVTGKHMVAAENKRRAEDKARLAKSKL